MEGKVATAELVTLEASGIVRFPPALLERAGINTGEELEVQPHNGWLALKKKTSIAKKLRGRIKIAQDTVAEILFAPELEYEAF